MDKFKKVMAKGKSIPEDKAKAKLHVLKDLKEHAMGLMGDKLKKVTVAADSKEGVEKGLDKAKEILHRMPASVDGEEEEVCPECSGEGCPMCEGEESAEHEASESPEFESGEHEGMDEESSDESEMSEEELDAKIQELMKKKEALKHKAF
jgi:hypothetical protein